MRHSAWLDTVPEKSKQPRRKCRSVRMPPLCAGHYLIEILFEAGPTKPAGMGGVVALDDLDLLAWQINQGMTLSAWECRTVRHLAREYAAMLVEARDPNYPPPYIEGPPRTADARRKITSSVVSWLDKLDSQMAR